MKFRLAWIICALLLAGFLANSISNYLVSKANVRATITQSSLPLTSDNVYSEIQRDLLSPIFISSLMANDTFLKDWALDGESNIKQITKYLNELKVRYSTVTSFFVSEKTREYYHAHGLLKTVSESDPRDDWYFRVRDMKAPYEINVDPDQANQDEMTIFINYRVRGYKGEFIGVAGVGLTVNRVNLLISSYEAKFDRHILFADKTGNIALSPSNSTYDGFQNIEDIEGIGSIKDLLLKEGKTNASFQSNNRNYMLNCRFVPELNWYLLVIQGEDAMLSPFKKQLWINISIALLITFIVSWLSMQSIIKYNQHLEKQNRELSYTNAKIESQKQEIEKTNRLLSERNKEKDEFISIVAHDLRNPLNGILGLCEITEVQQIDLTEFIRDIQISSEQMLSLINTLLEVSRVEAHHDPLVTEPFEINPLIDSVLNPVSKAAARKNITIETHTTETENLKIDSNPDWFGICLSNLITNAVKYTQPYGHVTVHTEVGKDNQSLSIFVSDTGPGISEEDQKKLYGKFVRLSAKPTGGESSTGLGLYVVKSMCIRLGIDVQIKSSLGKGTTFCLKAKLPTQTQASS